MRALLSKSFSVEMSYSRTDFPTKATATLTIQRPHRMRYNVKFNGEDFEAGYTEDGLIDLSRSQRVYMETSPMDRLFAPTAHYSELPLLTFPLVLLVGDPRAIFPSATPPALVGSAKIGSVMCDQVRTKDYEAWVAADGRLMRYRWRQARRDELDVTMDFTNYKIGGTYPRSTFEPAIPAGFRPFVLPRETVTYQAGSAFPANDWVSSTGAPVKFEAGKPYLAMVTTDDCEVSGRAKGALATLKKDLAVWILTDSHAPAGLEGFSIARDKSGRTLERMFVPSTPFFYLVGKDGKIKKLWLGFESEREDGFVKSVRAELGKG